MATVPSLQLLALLAIDAESVVYSIVCHGKSAKGEESSDDEDEATKDTLRHLLTFASNLRRAVAKEIDQSPDERFDVMQYGAYKIGINVTITNVPFSAVRKSNSSNRQLELDLLRDTFVGKMGTIEDNNFDENRREELQDVTYKVKVGKYGSLRLKVGDMLPIISGKVYASVRHTESCYECCRAFHIQVPQLYALYRDCRLLLCRDCLKQEPSPHCCDIDRVHSHGTSRDRIDCMDCSVNFEDKEKQDAILARILPDRKKQSESSFGKSTLPFLFILEALELRSVLSRSSWSDLSLLVKLSRRLENVIFLRFPEMRRNKPLSCRQCSRSAPGFSRSIHVYGCGWPRFPTGVSYNETLCLACRERSKLLTDLHKGK